MTEKHKLKIKLSFFDPHDFWMGFFWQRWASSLGTGDDPDDDIWIWRFHICPLPMFLIKIDFDTYR